MNKLIIILLATAFSCTTGTRKMDEHNHEDHASHDHNIPSESTDKKAKSPHTAAMANIGENHIHIDYSSPRVRGRVIFGGLVGYDEIWSTGAHSATSITFSQDVMIGDKAVNSGKYALFTIPGKEEWTVILNKNWDQHLADDYKSEEDILRLKVKPIMNEHSLEELTFEVISKDENSGTIRFHWAKTAFEFSIKNN